MDYSVFEVVEKPYFFVRLNDPSLKKVVNSFCRQQSMEKVMNAWQSHRNKTEMVGGYLWFIVF